MSETTKGQYNGLCNRSACLKPGATFYNYSTKAYYCPECAKLINDANRVDAMRMYGHDLCTEGEYKEKPNVYKITTLVEYAFDRPVFKPNRSKYIR